MTPVREDEGFPAAGEVKFRTSEELLNGEIFCSLAQAAVLVEQWRREYNTVRPHSACGGFPPAPEAIKLADRRQRAGLGSAVLKGAPASTSEIRKALIAGKVRSTARKFHLTLYNTLRRMREEGVVVNLGEGVWALLGP